MQVIKYRHLRKVPRGRTKFKNKASKFYIKSCRACDCLRGLFVHMHAKLLKVLVSIYLNVHQHCEYTTLLFNKTTTSPIITSGDPVNGSILKKCQKQFGTQFLLLLQYSGPSSHNTNSHPSHQYAH